MLFAEVGAGTRDVLSSASPVNHPASEANQNSAITITTTMKYAVRRSRILGVFSDMGSTLEDVSPFQGDGIYFGRTPDPGLKPSAAIFSAFGA
jgi:hypothetical protein